MAFVDEQDDEEQNQQGMNVLGGQTPGQQQAPAQPGQPEQPQSGGAGGAFIGQGGATPQPGQQAQQPGKPKGSGMFTDVRKYVQANKPQAQRISGAVQGNIQQQQQQVQKGLEKKSKSFQDRIAEQRARLGQAQGFAQQQIQQAGQGQGSQDIDRFRSLITGKQKFNVADTLNTAQEKLQSQRMAKQAALSERATGASNLLRDTFGANRQYTRGQRGLDELVLGGDTGARQAIVDRAQQAAADVQQQLRGARQEATEGRSDLLQENIDFAQDLQSQLTGEREGLQQDVTGEVARRQEEMRAQQAALQEAIRTGSITQEMLNPYMDQATLADPVAAYNARRRALEMATTEGGFGDLRNMLTSSGGFTGSVTADQVGGDKFLAAELNKLASGGDELLSFHGSGDPVNVRGGGQGKFSTVGDISTANPDDIFRSIQQGTAGNIGKAVKRLGVSQSQFAQAQRNVQDKYANEINRLSAIKPITRMVSSARSGPRPVTTDPAAADRQALKQRMHSEIMSNLINQANPEKSQQQFMDELISNINQKRQLQGLNLSDVQGIQAGNVITDAQLARQSALAALAGAEGGGIQRVAGQAPSQAARIDLLNAMRKAGIRGI